MRDLTPNDPHDVPPFSLEGGGCGCAISPDSKELAFTENLDPEPATSTSANIFTLDLTNPAAKPVKVSTSAGGNFNPAYSPDGKWLAWRSRGARRLREPTSSGWCCTTGRSRRSRILAAVLRSV